jgi:hypothetical protein
VTPSSSASRALLALLSILCVCCGGPTTPSGDASLTVRVIDEVTSLPIIDPVFAISVHLTGPATYSQTINGGTASFSGMVPGTYSLTTAGPLVTALRGNTDFPYGYRQLDVISVAVDRPQTFTLRMLPVDDLEVTEVFVDGQGSIPKGGTITVPSDGLNLTFRGRYQLVKYPRPSRLFFTANPFAAGFGYGTANPQTQGPPSDVQWEFIMSRWIPCLGGATNMMCVTASESILLGLLDPTARAGAGTTIMSRLQTWPLTYLLAPDCCKYPL